MRFEWLCNWAGTAGTLEAYRCLGTCGRATWEQLSGACAKRQESMAPNPDCYGVFHRPPPWPLCQAGGCKWTAGDAVTPPPQMLRPPPGEDPAPVQALWNKAQEWCQHSRQGPSPTPSSHPESPYYCDHRKPGAIHRLDAENCETYGRNEELQSGL